MKKLISLTVLALASFAVQSAIEVVVPETWTLYRGTSIVQPRVAYPDKATCQTAAPLDVQHRCVSAETFVRRADAPPPTCTIPQPAAESRTVQCSTGTTGSWTQTLTYNAAPHPTCWIAGSWAPTSAPSGACTPIVTPPPTGAPLLVSLQNFAEIAARNWSYGGHNVAYGVGDASGANPFNSNFGYWDYTNTTYEPWLFNRPEAWKRLCDLTGVQKWCDQAQSDLAYYQSRISPAGYFMNKTGEDDTKYGYVHPWSTRADNAAIAKRIYDASVAGWPNSYSPGAGLWTERELWVAMKAAIRYHDISGDPAALARAQSQVDQWDQVAAGRKAPLVTYTQHEGGGPGGTQPGDLVTSPWMAALYFQAAREYIAKVPAAAPQVYRQASDYFDYLNTPGTRGFYPGTDAHPEYAGLTFPAYLAGGTTIGDAGPDEGNMGHSLDVAGFTCFAIKAKEALVLPTAAVTQRLAEMKATAARDFALQTRTAPWLPKYRVNPPRKFNWMVHGYNELRVNGCE